MSRSESPQRHAGTRTPPILADSALASVAESGPADDAGADAATGTGMQPPADLARWPLAQALRHRALLTTGPGGRLVLLADRPVDWLLVQVAEARLGQPVAWQAVAPASLDTRLREAEATGRALDALQPDLGGPGARPDSQQAHALSLATATAESSPAIRLLDAVLFDALKDGASDIHIESRPTGAVLRLRRDGVLAVVRAIEGAELAAQLVSRLKVLAELDIAEHRIPQDGRFKTRLGDREIDFRLSVLPSIFGEDAVIRVLDRSQLLTDGSITLAGLGFDAVLVRRLLALAAAPHGMLLVTGPTGSGKTTTLYAAITAMQTGAEKIITIEDPVEYQLPGVVQIPVNERKGLGFARGLRAVLRHDPDRVMVGEIRDGETAQIAVQAALTGHLVYSTLHANGALPVLGRLMHLGLDPHNLATALNAVLAQRLLRKVCPRCAEPLAVDAVLRDRLGPAAAQARPARGRGCPACHGQGLRGRMAVAELLEFDDALRDLVADRAPLGEIRRAALATGMQPLRQAAMAAVAAGTTTLEEVDRVLGIA